MKVAFTGKGGVGKTTLAGLLVHHLAAAGQKVLAADCDPDSNLASVLGFEDASGITPISKMKDLIRTRMGVQEKGSFLVKLNPDIDDIPAAYTRRRGLISLLVMGTVEKGGGGCICPESTFLRNLLNKVMLKKDEHIVLDMEAGIEHLGRRTAESCDYFIVVVEPSLRSAETALRIGKLAADIGIKNVVVVGNKIRSKADSEFIVRETGGLRMIAEVPYDERIARIDKGGSVADLKDISIGGLMETLRTLTAV